MENFGRWLSSFTLIIILCWPSNAAAKTPAWGIDEHPRLLASASEKATITAKLNAPNTLSHAIWASVLTNYRRAGINFDYSDGAVVYWITGDVAAADAAIANAQSFMTQYPDGMTFSGYNIPDYPVDWWRYHNLLTTFDFAYGRLTSTQRTQFRNFIARQGAVCSALDPSYHPGNIDMAFAICALGSAVVLEGYDGSRDIQNEAVARGSTANSGDRLYFPADASALVVSSQPNGAGTLYRQGIDYNYAWVPTCGNPRCIDWRPTASGAIEPPAASTYYVSYHWNANLDSWKNAGRRAVENHLSFNWFDGIYNGGLNPYGLLAANYLPYYFEILKRDLGIDYSKNSDAKKAIDPYLYERLPGTPRRFNSINDSTSFYDFGADAMPYPTQSNYRPWIRPFISWATSAYASDPEGYGQRAFWLWAQSYRNTNGTVIFNPDADWRDAFWINDSLAGTYPNTALPAANWPKNRYFRGKEIVYTRSAAWGDNDPNALVASFIAGNHNNQNEHDQGDSGSFTFFNTGEDWAIDPGYNSATNGGDSIVDHNGLGIDGHGYDASGVYGISGANPTYGGFSHFDTVVLTDSASAMKAELAGAWTLTSTPYVDHDQRYFAVVRGTKPAYIIVADDIQKDSGTHSFQWYLHTGRNNTIATSATSATVTGSKTGAKLLVQTLNPTSASFAVSTSLAGAISTHQKLTISASAVQNPNFLNVLIPTASGSAAPIVSRATLSNGVQGTVTWSDGTIDTILWKTGSGVVTGGGVSSDGKLTIVRTFSGSALGLIVIDGRLVSLNSQSLLTVADGTKPATVVAFGPNMGLAASDATVLTARIPNVTSATLEEGDVSAPVSINGSATTVNLPFSVSEMRRGAGIRFSEDFDDSYANYFYRYNLSSGNSDKFLIKSGALELSETASGEPMTITRRDSTPWRRADIYPTVIPALEHGDAIISFRFKFSQLTAATRKLRFYLRAKYRNPVDWIVNQDYVRVELNAQEGGVVKNLINVGQRVNGDLLGPEGNDTITNPVASATSSFNDTNWHSVSIFAQGEHFKLSVDGGQLIDTNLPLAQPTAPASGFLQWQVTGSDSVLLDDVLVQAISTKVADTLPPGVPGGLNLN